MINKLTLGVRAHDVGLESLPSCFSDKAAETLADRVSAKHFSAVQFTMADAFPAVKFTQLNQGMAWQLRKAFEKRNIQIAILSCYINPIHPDTDVLEKELACFRRYLEFCRELGSNYVATETGSRSNDLSFHRENHNHEAMEDLLKSLHRMLTWASGFGVGIAIEGVSKFVACSPKVIREILDRMNSVNLKVILDPVNLLEPSDSGNCQQKYINIVKESFDLYGDDIVAVHLKDFCYENGNLINMPVGMGLAPFDFVLGMAASRKPGLPVIMEEQNPSTMDNSVSFIEKLLNSQTDTWQ